MSSNVSLATGVCSGTTVCAQVTDGRRQSACVSFFSFPDPSGRPVVVVGLRERADGMSKRVVHDEVLYVRSAGLDLGKRFLVACIRTPNPKRAGTWTLQTERFDTTMPELRRLLDWLLEARVEVVVLEATSDYWRSVYYLLQPRLNMMLVNPSHLRGIRGRKTDPSDAAFLARAGSSGMVLGSFVPPREIRELRDVTRRRTELISTLVKDRPCRRIKDLPASGKRVALWWRKRRLICSETTCAKRSFIERVAAIRPRRRMTERLREQLATSIAVSNRAVADVGREYLVSWHTAHEALIAAAAGWLPAPAPTRVLGIDETQVRTVRWVLADAGWRRTDPWLTSFVDADPTRPGPLLGLAPGRSGACVSDWLKAQTAEFRAGIEVVVIDPSAPYASGIRTALPDVKIVVDKFHLVLLANQMLTAVRQRRTREQFDRRGRKTDPPWAHRRMLLTAGEQLSRRQLDRLGVVLAADPTDQLGAAWAIKELLRRLPAARNPADIRRRLYDCYAACADADMPETTRLATTIVALVAGGARLPAAARHERVCFTLHLLWRFRCRSCCRDVGRLIVLG